MTSSIFETWIRKLDRKYLLQGRSIVMVLDNCPAHPKIKDLKAIGSMLTASARGVGTRKLPFSGPPQRPFSGPPLSHD
ncbi:tigger transposable element-derived protein 4 [Plakobranchus ocellatus]|uniref:Tigger transposable element-derived protein 4 n=1 Tax=Plakobranchus ocellatus TaxID=259542 RepID=A0AAV4C5T5_9GAST|nr:tigger transposable element-derived protein 4 [Plakobranchus ocellatus]